MRIARHRNHLESGGRFRRATRYLGKALAKLVRGHSNLSYQAARALILCAAALPLTTLAQVEVAFDQYELHPSAFVSTLLTPEVAATYRLTRGKNKGVITLAVTAEGETHGRPMLIKGSTWDLISGNDIEFQEIKEGDATYYVASFEFIDREWRWFEVHFRPEGADQTYTHKFKQQFWVDE